MVGFSKQTEKEGPRRRGGKKEKKEIKKEKMKEDFYRMIMVTFIEEGKPV